MMRWTKTVLVCLLGIALAAQSAPAIAQSKPRNQPQAAPAPPPQFHVDVATRSMALQRLGITVPVGSVIGTASFGGGCGSPTRPIFSEHAFRGIPNRDYATIFNEEAAAANYRLVNPPGSLFPSDQPAEAEILVGASISAIKETGCPEVHLIEANGAHINATITVDWQVYDPLEKKLLFRVTNTATATARMQVTGGAGLGAEAVGGAGYGHLPADAMRAAFRESAKEILANPEFLAAVREPNGGAPAHNDPAALFPEAGTQAGNAAPALPPIPRLPPNTGAFKDAVTALREQVVTVENADGTGSGFYIADGLLMTNEHVVHGTPHVKVQLLGGRKIDGEVVAANAHRDVALVKTGSIGFPGMPLQLDQPQLAAQVYVIGSPKGPRNEGSIITGIVSAFRTESKQPYIQSDAPVAHGNSGGPMLDEHGNVIGLTDLGTNGAAAVNLFIPIGDALKVLGIAFAPDSGAAGAAAASLNKPNP